MFRQFINPLGLLFAPEDTGNTGPTLAPLSIDEMMEQLAKDAPAKEDEELDLDDKPAKSKDVEDSDDDNEDKDKDDEKTLEDELEEDLKEPDDDELELARPVSRREILNKYPKLFKDFPELQTIYFREGKFSEIVGTLKDAERMKENSDTLELFEKDMMEGNTEAFLRTVKENSPTSFNKIADDYLDVLNRVDSSAYLHVAKNLISGLLGSAASEAKKGDDEVLLTACAVLNKYVFGTNEYVAPQKLSKGNSQADTESARLAKEREDWNNEKFDSVKTDLDERVTSIFTRTIEKNIAEYELPPYASKFVVREAQDSLEKLIKSDARFGKIVENLWNKAKQDKFSKNSLENIKKAFLEKGKQLLPSVIKKASLEARKGLSTKSKVDSTSSEDEDESDMKDKKIINTRKSGQPAPKRGKIMDPKDIPRGMSTLEFIQSQSK